MPMMWSTKVNQIKLIYQFSEMLQKVITRPVTTHFIFSVLTVCPLEKLLSDESEWQPYQKDEEDLQWLNTDRGLSFDNTTQTGLMNG